MLSTLEHRSQAAHAAGDIRFRCSGLGYRQSMIVLGLVLMLIGFLLGIPILWTLGIILVIAGVVVVVLGAMGRAVGGRSHYW
jgi:hypothetical protein